MLKSMKRKLRKYREISYVSVFVGLLLLLYLWPNIFIFIGPGHNGVLFHRFFGGTVTDRYYSEGVSMIFPWDIMYIYDCRVQEESQVVPVLTKNGLTVQVEVSMRFRLLRVRLPELHQMVGPDYKEKVIHPVLISSTRETVGNYLPEDLYTRERQRIQDEILVEAMEEFGRIPLLIDGVVIKQIKLPEYINKAIEEKLREEQVALKYTYLIQQAKMEAKRMYIEAQGIRVYQELVNNGLTDNYLRYQGIEATRDLASSTNAKLVVVGGKDGLPLILNPDTLRESASTNSTASVVDPKLHELNVDDAAASKDGKYTPGDEGELDLEALLTRAINPIDQKSLEKGLAELDTLLGGGPDTDANTETTKETNQ